MYLTPHPVTSPDAATVPVGLDTGSRPSPITPTLAGPRDLSASNPVPETPGPFGQYHLGTPGTPAPEPTPPSAGGGPPAPT